MHFLFGNSHIVLNCIDDPITHTHLFHCSRPGHGCIYPASRLTASIFARIIRLPIAVIGILLGTCPLLAWLVEIFQQGVLHQLALDAHSPAHPELVIGIWRDSAAQRLDKLGMCGIFEIKTDERSCLLTKYAITDLLGATLPTTINHLLMDI
jgi:hypothetical protein